jgi:hypothetical protein
MLNFVLLFALPVLALDACWTKEALEENFVRRPVVIPDLCLGEGTRGLLFFSPTLCVLPSS